MSPNHIFHLRDAHCVPTIKKKNLVSVHHFIKYNNVYLKFHPSYFSMKDRITRTTLLQCECEHAVYPLLQSLAMASNKTAAYAHEHTTIDGWYKILGHSALKVFNYLISTFSLPTKNKNGHFSLCNSCSQNKVHC